MFENDSNLTFLKCPYCKKIVCEDFSTGDILTELKDGEESILNCSFCGERIKVSLQICCEYNYEIEKLTQKEIEKDIIKEETEKDIPGQLKMWE